MDFAMTARTASHDTMTFMLDHAAECMRRVELAALLPPPRQAKMASPRFQPHAIKHPLPS